MFSPEKYKIMPNRVEEFNYLNGALFLNYKIRAVVASDSCKVNIFDFMPLKQ